MRDITDKETRPVAYQAHIGTLGSFCKAAGILMEIIGEEYKKGNDYFRILKPLQFFKKVIDDTECIVNSGLRNEIRVHYLTKQKDYITELAESNKITDEIKKFSLNVLTAYYRKSHKLKS
jgi:hypothetical protein